MYSTVLDLYLRAGHWFPHAVHPFLNISLVFLLGMKGAQCEDDDDDDDDEVLKNM
jgi:hypothetical protein